MSNQNYANHRRLIPLWHFYIPLTWLALLVGSIINLCKSAPANHYSAALIVVIVVILGLYWAYIRLFALRAQDRAIRAEERLRHLILTGKPLDSRLRMSQIIGLRFASDEEFPGLAKRAADENLNIKQIKQAVQNWRGDYHRV